METESRTREVSYTVCVPQERTRTYNVTTYDCVTEQVPETYTVCVPVQTMKEVQVQVCQQVPVTVDCCGNVVEAAAPVEMAPVETAPAEAAPVEAAPAAPAEAAPVAEEA